MINKENKKEEVCGQTQRGIALISAVLLLTVLFAIAFTLSAVLIPKIRTSSDARRSVTAIFAADSALEWCLYVRNNEDALDLPPTMTNNSTYTNGVGAPLDALQCRGEPPIKVVGSFPEGSSRAVTRAFEISF